MVILMPFDQRFIVYWEDALLANDFIAFASFLDGALLGDN